MKNSTRGQAIVDLDRPSPTLRRVMRVLGWSGVIATVIGSVLLAIALLDRPTIDWGAVRSATRLTIGGLMAAAIGWWDRPLKSKSRTT